MRIKDGDWELVNHCFHTGRTVWRYYDGSATHYRTDYPVDEIVRSNQAFMNDSQGQKFGDGKRVASIPLNVFYDSGLAEAQAHGDDRFVNNFLNDGDNRAFRTFEGHL